MRAYQGIRVAWYHILFIVVVSILAFQIPELFLVAEQWKSKEKRMSGMSETADGSAFAHSL